MNKIYLLFISVLIVTASGCKDEAAPGHQDYGAGVAETTNLTLISNIMKDPASFDGKTVTVKGVIASVCPKSGCFLDLGEGSAKIRVDLMEGGFTVPRGKNIGHIAYATGTVRVSGAEVKIAGLGVRIMEK